MYIKKVLFSFVFIGIVPLLGLSEGTVSKRLDTYQSQVRIQATGVYEIDDALYVHVRMPKSDSDVKQRARCVLLANKQLKDWAVRFAAAKRIYNDGVAKGVEIAIKVLNEANSQWRYFDWHVKTHCQELSGTENGEYWFGQIFEKDAIVKQIPSSFYDHIPSTQLVLRVLREYAPLMKKKDGRRFLSSCGAIDLVGVTNASVCAEFDDVNAKMEAYLSSSAHARATRERAKRIKDTNVTNWYDRVVGISTNQMASFDIKTNQLENVSVATNVVKRRQTPDECAQVGVAENLDVVESLYVSEPEEIVETRTVTTVTIIKKVRRQEHRKIVGRPRFEEIFLSGGKNVDSASDQRTSGAEAAKAYFGGTDDLSGIEQRVLAAICENPGDVQMWNMYGNCRLNGGDGVGALICFRVALKMRPDDQFALANLMRTYGILGYENLSLGLAVVVYGLSEDAWCRKKAEELLLK